MREVTDNMFNRMTSLQAARVKEQCYDFGWTLDYMSSHVVYLFKGTACVTVNRTGKVSSV